MCITLDAWTSLQEILGNTALRKDGYMLYKVHGTLFFFKVLEIRWSWIISVGVSQINLKQFFHIAGDCRGSEYSTPKYAILP